MQDYTFRLRFVLAPHTAINIAEPEFQLMTIPPDRLLTIRSASKDTSISNANDLELRSSSWPSEHDALTVGARCREALMFACARMHLGIDLGYRPPRSMVFRAGLEMFEQQLGTRVLNDIHGLMAYETEPTPRFVSFNSDYHVGRPGDLFRRTLQAAFDKGCQTNEREKLAFELFNSSFFQDSPNTRVLLLVMAIECLLESKPRPQPAVLHIDQLVDTTRNASALPPQEREAILTALGFLRNESIRQTGRRFCNDRLDARQYLSMSAAEFFDHCYNLRSRLAHGSIPVPSHQELVGIVPVLETFVSDILIGDLRDLQ